MAEPAKVWVEPWRWMHDWTFHYWMVLRLWFWRLMPDRFLYWCERRMERHDG